MYRQRAAHTYHTDSQATTRYVGPRNSTIVTSVFGSTNRRGTSRDRLVWPVGWGEGGLGGVGRCGWYSHKLFHIVNNCYVLIEKNSFKCIAN